MFTNCGPRHGFSQKLDRRSFLKIGGLGLGGLGGLGLGDVLRLQAETKVKTAPRAIIMVCLAGGPSHLETYDMKPHDESSILSRSDQIQYVLEVNQGWFKRNNIGPGAIIRTERGPMRETFFKRP